MNDTLLYSILALSSVGVVAVIVLWYLSQKFKVEENPEIDKVMEELPNTNCGGCGYPGCRGFAEALVDTRDLEKLHCPVGGNEVMKEVAAILGLSAVEKEPYVAVVRCSGSFEYRKKTNVYDGAQSCSVAAQLYTGDTGCAYGCLGMGECADACDFEAMYMDEKTGLPVVIEDKCTACNACVTACPKDIMTLIPKGRKDKHIFVACLNEDKGGVARKTCEVACSGCSKCQKVCRYDAIDVTNYLATIDNEKCKACGECVDVCEAGSIMAANFTETELDKADIRRDKRIAKEKEKARLEREKAKQEREKAKLEKQNLSDKKPD